MIDLSSSTRPNLALWTPWKPQHIQEKANMKNYVVRWKFIFSCWRNQNDWCILEGIYMFLFHFLYWTFKTASVKPTLRRAAQLLFLANWHPQCNGGIYNKIPSQTAGNKSRPKLKGDREEGFLLSECFICILSAKHRLLVSR